LLCIQLEPSMQRCDACVTQRTNVFRARPPARPEIVAVLTLLRVSESPGGDRECGRTGKNNLPDGIPPMANLMLPMETRVAAFLN
jgi:hypothetical protein